MKTMSPARTACGADPSISLNVCIRTTYPPPPIPTYLPASQYPVKCWGCRKASASMANAFGYDGSMDETDTRQAIKDTALELLVRHGYRGTSFGDISAALGTTRANIHYHFGNKQALVDEVLGDYMEATLSALRAVWSDEGANLSDQVEAMIAYSRGRFLHFNPPDTKGRNWSLITRLRQDAELLGADGQKMLDHFGAELSMLFTDALSAAGRRGELAPNIVPSDAALLLAAIADNAAPITLAEGGFDMLEKTYRSLAQIIKSSTY
ncbi:TetR/AcrR family transcriptional regulator [Mesorhizobium sp. ESP7-2]|uniref:TetR/AcrR family transcriptional regulator n=1 Tax=Mesorhizobium sp. ESP7-2 TaxID=2876622 RepID=UPI001CCE31C1|nr:TetR/AcrR family transcriptional regulator [Mesorhizobium sp. ESP7-2]MBZ9710404.1 TetR/AcrR family transcriptional regulator [Mesorhizobium sp. ESP7-2]